MRSVGRLLRNRLLPAVLTAAGVTLIAAGLLSYSSNASAADPSASIEPDPTLIASGPDPSMVLPTLPPPGDTQSPEPTLSPSPNPNRVATRVVVDAMNLQWSDRGAARTSTTLQRGDVPGIRGSGSGEGRTCKGITPARDGMFGPIYERAIQKHGGPQ